MAAIAAGRPPPPGWTETAEGRFERGEWGERQLLLRALAGSDGKVIPAVLAAAEEDWAGSPLAREVSRFLDARVAAGESWTVAELETLDASLQPLVRELIDGPTSRRGLRSGPRSSSGSRRRSTSTSSARSGVSSTRARGHRRRSSAAGSRRSMRSSARSRSSRPRSGPGHRRAGCRQDDADRRGASTARRRMVRVPGGANDVNAGQAFIGMLEARVQEIVDRVSRRPIVWVFPAFEEALWSGQHMQSPRGVLDALLPHVEAGDAVVVGEIDPRAYELVLQHRPRVARLFEVVRLRAATGADAIAVARGWADDDDLDVDDETLAEALDLATHYLPAAAAPGNVLRVLELVRDRIARGVASAVDPETVIATLSEATGLPLHVLDPRAPLSLERVRAYFEARVLGQPEAVECLVDRIALVKAGLTDPTRPLGVFLFVGPTGTGKTEIAKAFSAFVFGSEDRLVRLDMSEYQTPESLDRLLGDAKTPQRAGLAAHRPGPQAAVLRPPPRRVREGASADLGPLPPGLRRRPADRSQRTHGRPAPLRDHPHLEPRLGDPGRPGRRLRRQVGRVRRRDPCSSPSTARSDPSS